MKAVLVKVGRGASIALGVLLATASYGQAPQPAISPGVHRMEIVNGSTVTIRYFGKGLAPTELAALRDLERAENEALYADRMATLRQLYVTNEIALEARRHVVQTALFGTANQTTFGSYLGGSIASPVQMQMGATSIPNGYSLVMNPLYPGATVYPGQLANNPRYPNVYTPMDSGFGGAATTVINSLQYGMGDEGRFKDEMVKAIAGRYTPESTTAALRNLDAATIRVGSLPRLRESFGQPDAGGIALANFGPVTLTLKDNKELKGTLLREEGDWLVVQTDTEEVMIRKDDVVKRAKPLKKEK